MVHLKPSDWTQWLPLAEWWYNSSYHFSLKMFTFEALYGYAPPFLPMLSVQGINVAAVGEFINERQLLSQLLEEFIKSSE